MSRTKEFLIRVSIEIEEEDGDITSAVLTEAQHQWKKGSTKNHIHLIPCMKCSKCLVTLSDYEYRNRNAINEHSLMCKICIDRERDELDHAEMLKREGV